MTRILLARSAEGHTETMTAVKTAFEAAPIARYREGKTNATLLTQPKLTLRTPAVVIKEMSETKCSCERRVLRRVGRFG